MSVTAVQEPGTCSTIFQTVSDAASGAACWLGKTVSAIGSTIADFAQKAAEFAKPHFEKLGEFVSNNRGPIMIAGVAAILGAMGGALIASIFNRGTAQPAQNNAANPNPVTT